MGSSISVRPEADAGQRFGQQRDSEPRVNHFLALALKEKSAIPMVRAQMELIADVMG